MGKLINCPTKVSDSAYKPMLRSYRKETTHTPFPQFISHGRHAQCSMSKDPVLICQQTNYLMQTHDSRPLRRPPFNIVIVTHSTLKATFPKILKTFPMHTHDSPTPRIPHYMSARRLIQCIHIIRLRCSRIPHCICPTYNVPNAYAWFASVTSMSAAIVKSTSNHTNGVSSAPSYSEDQST